MRRAASRAGADTQLVKGLVGSGGSTGTHLQLNWTGTEAAAGTLMTVTFYGPNSETTVKEMDTGIVVGVGVLVSTGNGLDNANWKAVCTAPGFRDVTARWNAGG